MLEHPGVIKNPDKLRDAWHRAYGGRNAHKVAVLEEGVKFTPISIPNNEAQFLETRKFQIEEIARMYRVPLHMIGDLDHATFSNVEHLSLDFVKYSLDPWIVRWEQSLQKALLSDSEKGQYFVKFNVDGLLRGDYASRMQGYATARQNGWMSANDIRELEDMNMLSEEEGGNLYLCNGSFTKLSEAGKFANQNSEKEEKPNEEILELYPKRRYIGNRAFVNGPISEDTWWGDEVTPALFRDELSKVSGNLTVWLNSPGGDVFAASQIYSMLKNHKGKVTVKIDGIAASAASVVAMAGDETLIAPTALMMIHDPSTCAMGNKADMEKAIILLDEVKESIINAYETKSHLSRNKIAKLMSDETWLNAKKAHEMGFVDGILFAEKKMPVVPKEEEPDEPDEEEKEDTLTAMTYSKSRNLSAFLSKVSASAESVTGTSIDQLEKRLALLKY